MKKSTENEAAAKDTLAALRNEVKVKDHQLEKLKTQVDKDKASSMEYDSVVEQLSKVSGPSCLKLQAWSMTVSLCGGATE